MPTKHNSEGNPVASADDEASVRAWMAAWGEEVAGVDLETARARFAPDVSAFGTFADAVQGIDRLHDEQWSRIWPAIEDFRFELDRLSVLVSPDRLQAVAVVPWSSTGRSEDGERFPRPGRATVVLGRPSTAAGWLGLHTHFSLARDTPREAPSA